jgi:hypothetical protein
MNKRSHEMMSVAIATQANALYTVLYYDAPKIVTMSMQYELSRLINNTMRQQNHNSKTYSHEEMTIEFCQVLVLMHEGYVPDLRK